MSVQYNVSKCKNPGKNALQDTQYYSCKAKKVSDYTFEELAEDVANATTVTRGDAMAVLASIKPFIRGALLGGRRVVLNDLGALKLGIRSKCFSQDAMAASDFSAAAQIKGHTIIFQPEPKLKKEIAAAVTFRRVTEA